MPQLIDYQPIEKILNQLPENTAWVSIRRDIREKLNKSSYKLIVLDDDPTGVQTVHDIYVITDWGKDWIKKGLSDDRNVLYILTNTRSYGAEEAERINREIVQNLCSVARELNIHFSIISRGDSTLRGHYPLEIDVLADQLEESCGVSVSGHLIVPAFFEAHRYTIGNTHYLAESGNLVPTSDTEFSNDAVFGYSTAHLPDYISEKSGGRVSSSEVVSISLEDIREGGVDKVYQTLLKAENNQPIIINAASYQDLDIVSLAVLQALEAGKHFLSRTAASFVKSLGGFENRPYVKAEDLQTSGTKGRYGGLIIVGSHTKKTTEQIKSLMDQTFVQKIEMNVPKLLDARERDSELHRVIGELEVKLASGLDTVIYTSRGVIKVEGKEENLHISQSVSGALVAVVQSLAVKPRFIIAKGGITSSDIATKGLGIKKAKILGQAIAGVPVWFTGSEAHFQNTPYIVFPGNVGNRESILEIVRNLQ